MKRMIFLTLLALSPIASAKTYYVATTGKDGNPGTIDAPWGSWQKGFETAQAGDTVFFRGGAYYPTAYSHNQSVVYLNQGYEGAPVIGHDGTAGNPICFFAYPPDYEAGNFPILDCKFIDTGRPGKDEQKYSQAIVLMMEDYIQLKGLTVRNLYQRYSNVMTQAIYCVAGSNMIFENMTVHNIGGRGIVSFQDLSYTRSHSSEIISDTTEFINCDVYNLCDSLDPDPSYQYENPRTSYVAGLADGFKLQHSTGGCIRVSGCRMWHFSDDGLDFNGPGLLIVENCWVSRGGDFSFTNEDGTYGGQEGNGIKYGAMVANIDAVTRIIRNNILACNGGIGFDENNSRVTYFNINSQIYNNTSYDNLIGFGNFSCNSNDLPYMNKFFNNISYKDRRYARGDEDGDIIEGYNSWVTGNYQWPNAERIPLTDADFISVDTSQLYLPRKNNGSLPDITFLKLASNSDAIDAGVDVGLPFYGKAPDIGYSEYVAGSITPPSPEYVSSVIENAFPSRIDVTYSLSLANVVPATSAFSVTVNSSARTVSSVSVSGTKVLLTLASAVAYGDVVTIAYTKPTTNPLQTAGGGKPASITAQNVTNNVAVINPVYFNSVIENATPSRLEMTYSLSLANVVPATSAFSVTVNSSARTVNSVSVSGTKVLLNLASAVAYGDVVTVAYAKPSTNPLQTAGGGQAASITAQNVTNNVAVINPVYLNSVIENATPSRLEMTYSLSLANVVPATSAFSVMVNSSARSVSSVTISGTKVLLTLTSPIVYGDAVTVTYTKPSLNPLQTSAGGQATSITVQSVINNCSLSANLPPVITITSPTKSITFVAPATITIEATASDPDGSISKVEFYNGSTKLGESYVSPFSLTWKEVPAGTYSIIAVATDNLNAKTFSGTVNVVVETSANNVNQLPVVSILKPNNGKKHKKNDAIVIEAVASDPDGTISMVEFKSGNITLAQVTTAPYIYVWEDADTGTYIITAIATDNLGATSTSSEVELSVLQFNDANPEIINLYPNPNDGHFAIDIYSGLPEQNNRIAIVSLSGKTIVSNIIMKQESYMEFDLSNLTAGTYVLLVNSRDKIVATKKFIIE
jgi:uncharacterized repeat protein (TIGR02059 family)